MYFHLQIQKLLMTITTMTLNPMMMAHHLMMMEVMAM